MHKMQPGIIPDLTQGEHRDAGTAGSPTLCPSRCCSSCSSSTFPASAAPGACCKLDSNWAGRLELTRGHVRTAQWQFGLSQCSGSRQAERKIKVRRPIRDSAWHVLLSTRINLSLFGNGLPCSITLSHSASSSWLSTCHLQQKYRAIV